MTDARTRVMANIRRGLGRTTPMSAEQAAAARRDAVGTGPAPHPVWDEGAVTRFTIRFEAEAGTWETVSGLPAVGDAVAGFMADRSLGPRLLTASHTLLREVAWPEHLDILSGTEHARDCRAAVSVADMGIAETGTLVLYSGPESPTSLAFLPEIHIVVLRETDVVNYMEEVWQALRKRGDFPPRSLNFITGPSRTADVEQTIQLGAHGPRALHVILVGEA